MITHVIWDLGETLTTPPPNKTDFKPLNEYENIKLRPKVKDTLATISAMNIGQAVLSNTANSDGDDVERLLEKLEVSRNFKYILGTKSELTEGKPEKPNTEVFRKVLEALNVNAEETLMIGNNWDTDILGANTSGIHAVWISNPNVSAREDYTTKVEAPPWVLPIWDIEDVPTIINYLNK